MCRGRKRKIITKKSVWVWALWDALPDIIYFIFIIVLSLLLEESHNGSKFSMRLYGGWWTVVEKSKKKTVGQFHQRFKSSFYKRKSLKRKKYSKVVSLFCAFGICECKNCSWNVDEIDSVRGGGDRKRDDQRTLGDKMKIVYEKTREKS